jgi:hypothetical protein
MSNMPNVAYRRSGSLSRVAGLTAVVFLSLAGCASARTDLVSTGAVDLHVEQPPTAKFRSVHVIRDGDETIVSGKIKRLGVYKNPFAGARVTASAVYPDGSVRQEDDRVLTRTPRAQSFRSIYPDAKFRIEFPTPLPVGTTIHVRFSGRSHGNG